MTDSTIIMISISYGPRCEAFRFAWRKIRFVFAVLGLVSPENETRRPHRPMGIMAPRARRAALHLHGDPEAATVSFSESAAVPSGSSGLAFEAAPLPQNEGFGKDRTSKKLREGAAKPLKSFVRINLCARPDMRPKVEVLSLDRQAGKVKRPAAPDSRPNRS
jgi:hypothetical protein